LTIANDARTIPIVRSFPLTIASTFAGSFGFGTSTPTIGILIFSPTFREDDKSSFALPLLPASVTKNFDDRPWFWCRCFLLLFVEILLLKRVLLLLLLILLLLLLLLLMLLLLLTFRPPRGGVEETMMNDPERR
jgi:hypothetical protein